MEAYRRWLDAQEAVIAYVDLHFRGAQEPTSDQVAHLEGLRQESSTCFEELKKALGDDTQ